MKIQQLVVGQLQSNCYLVYDNKSKETMIIDPGDDAEYITNTILKLHLSPVKIIATHGHFDHIMAAMELQLAFNIPFLIHKKDEFLVKRMNQTSIHFTGIEAGPPPKIDYYLKPEDELKTKNLCLKVLHTPGHTPGSVSLASKADNIIIVGDLLFSGGSVGRTDFSYSQPNELSDSVTRVLSFQKNMIIYPGHGPETTIDIEQRFHDVGE